MQSGKITAIEMPALNGFHFQIKYTETDRSRHFHEINLHTHSEFEIYINLTGEVSFLVENTLYPLSRGDIIIARPGEHHHCVYRGDAPHRLFWILFDCESNKGFWDFLQADFKENYISPPIELRDEIIALCTALHGDGMTKEEELYSLLRLFAILKKSRTARREDADTLAKDISEIIRYINEHIGEEISAEGIANSFYISKSTLDRRFKEHLAITPTEFIRRKKLHLAVELLRKGESVLNAGMAVGYRDTSYFIELFKHYYGTTPYRYKRGLNGQR